jgi:hypothetical protein
LEPYLAELQATRREETAIIRDYLRRSFDVLIARAQGKLMDYEQRAARGADMELTLQEERRYLDDLRRRQASRLAENERTAVLSLAAPEVLGVAAVVPAGAEAVPEGQAGALPMRRSDEVEAAAMVAAMDHERRRGWTPQDVSREGRGHDVLSRGPDGAVRYIEVKGRAAIGGVELSANEWLKAEQLGDDYWLYVVTDALGAADVHEVRDPAHRLPGEEVVPQVRYRVTQQGWHRVAEGSAEDGRNLHEPQRENLHPLSGYDQNRQAALLLCPRAQG